jgi:hypothetical protein
MQNLNSSGCTQRKKHMADKKATPSPLARTATATPPETAIVDSRTGEVVDMDNGDRSGSDALAASALSVLSMGNLGALLDKAEKAKEADFQKLEDDFWNPGTPGTPEAIIQGMYVGSGKNEGARIIQHAIVRKGKDGQPVVVRLNGRHGLTSALQQLEPKDLVRIEYLGEGVSQGLVSGKAGNKFKQWKVTKIKQ